MPDPISEHRAAAPTQVRCALLTVSDTRTPQTDRGGPLAAELLAAAGHLVVERAIVPDEPRAVSEKIESLVRLPEVDVILLTGGTGIGRRDQTCEALAPLLTRSLPGFGELFRLLSFQEIGAAAMLSRALGGLVGSKVVLALPGSPAAVRLALEKLILPELGHLVQQARS